MEDQGQLFRFRLPWLSAAVTPLLATEPNKAPAQPATDIPIQRPPSRPPWIAAAHPPLLQAQAPSPSTEPQATAPSRAAGETRTTSQPASPSQPTTQTRDIVKPPSPSGGTTESRVAQAPMVTETISPSTPVQSQTTKEESPQPPPSASLEEQKLAAPQQPPVEAQPKPAESTTQNKTPTEPAIEQPPVITAQPPQASALVTETATNLTVATDTHAGSSDSNQMEEGMKVEEQTKEKELVRPASEAGETQEKTQEDATKKSCTTSITDEIHEKEIDADQKDGHKLDDSHQKHVPVDDGERVPLQQEIIEDFSKFIQKLTAEHAKLPLVEKAARLLALTGENRGAFMYLGIESGKKEESTHIHPGYNADDSPEATTDEERSYLGKQTDDSMTEEDSASNTYINSNTQSIGNSIVLDCSVNGRNPGVHLAFCPNLSEDSEQTMPTTESEPVETKKAGFNITPAEKNQE